MMIAQATWAQPATDPARPSVPIVNTATEPARSRTSSAPQPIALTAGAPANSKPTPRHPIWRPSALQIPPLELIRSSNKKTLAQPSLRSFARLEEDELFFIPKPRRATRARFFDIIILKRCSSRNHISKVVLVASAS